MEVFRSHENLSPAETIRILDQAQQEGKCFHGSKVPNLTALDPSKASDRHAIKVGGERTEIVFAAPGDYLLALILSLAKPIDPNRPMGLRISSRDGRGVPRVWSDQENITWEETGSVYVCEQSDFEPSSNDYEVYSYQTVHPEQEVLVTPAVLTELVENGRINCDIPIQYRP